MPLPETADRSYETVAEYANRHKLSPITVYRLIAAGELEAERFGRAIRIPSGS
jgi:excisionase family DNA binding protein